MNSSKKVLLVKINRKQIEDLIAMHLSALGKAPDADLTIIDVKGFETFDDMLTIRYTKRKEENSQ